MGGIGLNTNNDADNFFVKKYSGDTSIEIKPDQRSKKEDSYWSTVDDYYGKQKDLNGFKPQPFLSPKYYDYKQQTKLTMFCANPYLVNVKNVTTKGEVPIKIYGQWKNGIIDVNYNHIRITYNKDSSKIGEFIGLEDSGMSIITSINKSNNTSQQIELIVNKFIDEKYEGDIPRIKIARDVIKEQMPKIVKYIQDEVNYELSTNQSFNVPERLILFAIKQNVPEQSTYLAWQDLLCNEATVKLNTILKDDGLQELGKYVKADTNTLLYSNLIEGLDSYDPSYGPTAFSQASRMKQIAQNIYDQAITEIKNFDNNCKILFSNKELLIQTRAVNLSAMSNNTDLQEKLSAYGNYNSQIVDVAILNKNTAENTVLSVFLIKKSDNEYILLDPNYRGVPEYKGKTPQDAVNNYLNSIDLPNSKAIANLDNGKTLINKDYPPEGAVSKVMNYWANISIGAAVFSMFAPEEPISKGVAISGIMPMSYYAYDSAKSIYDKIKTNSFDPKDPKVHLDIAQIILAVSFRTKITPASMKMFTAGNALLLEGMARTVAEETSKYVKQGNYKKAQEALTSGIYSMALTLMFMRGQNQVSFKEKFLKTKANLVAVTGRFKKVVSERVSAREVVENIKTTASNKVNVVKSAIVNSSEKIIRSAKEYSTKVNDLFRNTLSEKVSKSSLSDFSETFSKTLIKLRNKQLQTLNILKDQAIKTGDTALMKEYSLKLAKLEQTTMKYLKEYFKEYIEMSDIMIDGKKIKYGEDYELIAYGRLGLTDHDIPVSKITDFDLKLICKNEKVKNILQEKIPKEIFDNFKKEGGIDIDKEYFYEDFSTIQNSEDFFAYFLKYLTNSSDFNSPLFKELTAIYKNAELIPHDANKRTYTRIFDFLLGDSSKGCSLKILKQGKKIPNHVGLNGVTEADYAFSIKYYGKRMGDMMIFMEYMKWPYSSADKKMITKISDFCCRLETYIGKDSIDTNDFNKLMQNPGQRKLILDEAKELGLITDKQITEYGQNYNKIGFKIFDNIVKYMDKQYLKLESMKLKTE